jgi:hypothetical protein
LSLAAAHRGAATEAREFAETMCSRAPFYTAGFGLYAGMLVRSGDTPLVQELLAKLHEGNEPNYMGLLFYHLGCGDADRAAEAYRQFIDQRSSASGIYFRIAQTLCPSPRWAAVAEKMNLPVDPVLG